MGDGPKHHIRAQSFDRIIQSDTEKMAGQYLGKPQFSTPKKAQSAQKKPCFKLKKVIGKGTYSTVYLTGVSGEKIGGAAEGMEKCSSGEDVVS